MSDHVSTVLAHAVGFTAGSLAPIAARIDGAISLDVVGHGRSPMTLGDGYSWMAAGRRLLEDLDAHGVEAPRVGFGHSGGGVALLWAEILEPGTFEALFLYEPPLRGVVPPDPAMPVPPLAETVARRRNVFADAADFEAYLRKRDPYRRFDDAALAGYIETGITADGAGGFRLSCPPALESAMYSSPDEGLVERLRELRIPVVLAFGERTFDRFAVMTQAALTHLPDGRAVELSGLTHFGPLEDPGRVAEVFRREVLDHLDHSSVIQR